jgi:hypothetical protein
MKISCYLSMNLIEMDKFSVKKKVILADHLTRLARLT